MKIKAKLRKLTDADVRYVSLVDRGANRIPFRIVKSDSKENQMGIDLSKLGLRVAKKDATANKATVSAVVIAKNDQALVEKVRQALEADGFKLTVTKSFEDGSVALAADEDFDKDATVIRLNENLCVVVKSFDQYAESMSQSALGEKAAESGFYEGVAGAMADMQEKVYAILQKGDASAPVELEEAIGNFQAYVTGLSVALPATVFKAEKPLTALVTEFKPEVAVEKKEEVVVEKKEGEAAKPDETVVKAEESTETKPAETAEVKKEEPKVETVAKADDAVLKSIESLTSLVTGLNASVQKMSGELDTVKKATEEKLAEVARKAETATRAVEGVVVASATAGDPTPEPAKVQKSDEDPRSGVFDSAMLRFNR